MKVLVRNRLKEGTDKVKLPGRYLKGPIIHHELLLELLSFSGIASLYQ